MVRAKFYVTAVTQFGNGMGKVELMAQYYTSIPEDQRFQKATPSGRMEMQIDNPVAFEQFEPGTYFYCDFTPAEPKPAG